ncbi:hypothetical protein MKX03_020668 [Papaver bracteatum]|nr:hypothetical protein MKX03_020668 [Papaver bracteatum]
MKKEFSRIAKVVANQNLPQTTKISFPNGMNFEVSIRPDEVYYNGKFEFTFQVSPTYPHEAPKVKCKTKVYHPKIELERNVCLNILGDDRKPAININTVIYGLKYLFTVLHHPNQEDPSNHEAAAILRDNHGLASKIRMYLCSCKSEF